MLSLVAIDLDETLLRPDRTISARAQSVIAQVRQLGCQVVLATGRMFCAAQPYAVELGLPGPLIAYQGGLIKTVAGQEMLRHLTSPREQLLPLLRWLETEPVHINLYVDDCLYVAKMNDIARRYAAYSRIPVQEVGRLSAGSWQSATKVVAVGDPDFLRQKLLGKAVDEFGQYLAVNRSYPHFLEFGHVDATKAQALAWLGKHLGISPTEMMAIGDGENDIDMLQFAGVGVAMGNAPAEVQMMADYVTGSNMEDGVASVLEKFFLSR